MVRRTSDRALEQMTDPLLQDPVGGSRIAYLIRLSSRSGWSGRAPDGTEGYRGPEPRRAWLCRYRCLPGTGEDTRPTLADACIDKKLSARAQKLAAVPLC